MSARDIELDDIRIETSRLILRLPEIADFDRYAELFCHPTAAKHIGGGLQRGDAWRRFLQMPGAWMLQGFAMFSVIEKTSGLWVGQAGPWQPDGWPGTEVGYGFHHEAWGNGYATEACAAAIDWAFDNLGWREVIHCIAPENTASQGVARRLGSTNRGPGKLPAPLDTHAIDIWGQTREQWLQRRARETAK
jgi:RimJ/RimL family protein N-acetyltransferase